MENAAHSEDLDQHIQDENNFSKKYFEGLKTLRSKLEADIFKLEDLHDEASTEVKVIEEYIYYPSVSEAGADLFCRRHIVKGEDQVLLDTGHLAKLFDYEQVIITRFQISLCQHYLGAVVEGRPDVYDGHIIQMIQHGQARLVDCICDILNLEFAGNNSVLYTKPFNLHASQVWRHQINSEQGKDKLVFEESDKRFSVDLSHTKDQRFVVINSNSGTTSELWLIDSQGSPAAPPNLIWPRQDGAECYLDHCLDTFYALTNAGESTELKLLRAKSSEVIQNQDWNAWEDLFTPPPGSVIQDLDVFSSCCVLSLMVNNIPQLAIIPYSTNQEPLYVELPSVYTTLLPGLNADISSTQYQFQLSSPIRPPRNHELDLKTCCVSRTEDVATEDAEKEDCSTFQDDESIEIWKLSKHVSCRRLMAHSKDGTEVPITIFHKDTLQLDGRNPMLVIGYGAYGRNVEMDYLPERAALLSHGWVLAFCHVRGGGELGRHWHRSGKLDRKHHSFEDFESCIKFLHLSGYSRPALTAGWAASAGCMLLGVLCNRKPELLKAAVMRMPFVDVLSSMLDSTSNLTHQDTEEWGDPQTSAAAFRHISSYCPYQNLQSQNYPSILVSTSVHDQHVPVWGPVKYVARLRDRTRDDHAGNCHPSFLLRVYTEGGHYGPDEGDGGVKQAIMEWTFLHKELGLAE